MASDGLAQATTDSQFYIICDTGWRTVATLEQLRTIALILASYNPATPPRCGQCKRKEDKAFLCWNCSTWRCISCARVDRIHISKLSLCGPCRVAEFETFRIAPPEVTVDVLEATIGYAAGVMNLEQYGGSFGYRHSPINGLLAWGRLMGVEVFPGSPEVYKHYIAHRVLCQGVSTATLENDFISIGLLHVSVRAKLGVNIHNPVKASDIRLLVKHLAKNVRVPSKMTVAFSWGNLCMMVRSLDSAIPRQLHAKVVIQIHSFPAMRRNAAKKLYLRRKKGKPHALDYATDSDVHTYPHPRWSKVMRLKIDVDKCQQPGQVLYSYVPDRLKCGLTPVSDVEQWITSYPLPDGPLLAAPTGPKATAFHKNEYTAADGLLASTWARTFPARVHEKIALHSLRKTTIQALYDLLKLEGKFSEQDVAEFVHWNDRKAATRAHYATLSQDEVCQMLHDLDENILPDDIATVGKPSYLV